VNPAANDSLAVEVGLKFRANTDGFITGIRFYKGEGNTGTHVGHLWRSDGTLLATAKFTGEAANGWQQANFDMPIAISANQTYVISYFAPAGHYAVSTGYFSSASTSNGPLTALAQGTDGANGVFKYGAAGGFPTQSGNGINYWVDVLFSTLLSDAERPTVTRQTPAPGATGVWADDNVTATFSEGVQSGTISLVLRDAADNVVPGNTTYDPSSHTVTFDPSGTLAQGATYTVSLGGAADAAGNVMANVNWSFTTAAPVSNAMIWGPSATPTTQASSDAQAVEVGVKFRAAVSGYVTGIRFYKGTGNSGTHVGHLWDRSGNLLATVTFANETASGWQQALFDSPVAIAANQTYVISYYAPVGHYAADAGYFATAGTTNGALTALANGVDGSNGVFKYQSGGGFPNQASGATNYWVDVVFSSVLPGAPASVAPGAVSVQVETVSSTSGGGSAWDALDDDERADRLPGDGRRGVVEPFKPTRASDHRGAPRRRS
jgi:hypothetical protein